MDEAGFESDFLRSSRVVIWGLGLMGGSLAMTLKGKCRELIGIDSDPLVIARARELGITDRAVTRAVEGLHESDLIVLAVPVSAIIDLLASLPKLCPGPAVVMDLGSTKREVVTAMAGLPERFDPVGGHPMCGKEKSSLEHAEAGLYQGAPFGLTALQRTSDRGRMAAEALVRAAGASPLWIEPDVHDQMVAATSHAPFLLASALAQATPPSAKPLVGPGFRSTARLAGSSSGMMVGVLETNADYIRTALGRIMEVLEHYDRLLAQEDFQLLAEALGDSAECYQDLSDGR